MNHDEREKLEKLLSLKDSEYYVWVYDKDRWTLDFRSLSPNRAVSYASGFARSAPHQRIKIMKGSTRVLFDGLSKNYNGTI